MTGSYNAAGRLADFNGSAADGTWRLFMADLVPGGGQSTLTSWSLGLTTEPVPVPEPGTMAVGVMAGLLLLIARARARRS